MKEAIRPSMSRRMNHVLTGLPVAGTGCTMRQLNPLTAFADGIFPARCPIARPGVRRGEIWAEVHAA